MNYLIFTQVRIHAALPKNVCALKQHVQSREEPNSFFHLFNFQEAENSDTQNRLTALEPNLATHQTNKAQFSAIKFVNYMLNSEQLSLVSLTTLHSIFEAPDKYDVVLQCLCTLALVGLLML